MSLSSILCSWIQLTERNKIWKFEENWLRKLNDTQSSKTMILNSLFSSSRLIFSSKTMILKAEYHYSFEIENLYHLLCFLILFLNKRTEKISIIYYVLSHSISRFSLKTRMSSTLSYWKNLYHLLCAFSFYFSIFFENMIMNSTHSYWENVTNMSELIRVQMMLCLVWI